ncbi:hypothetical protein [Caldicellulosiruptor saccharolyticus]|uniref:hypothetical protein n=1 Tax=Caldicellulosiruptor saccharolyticus TaxID=44001 RepID=UPI0005A04AE0|nr:hypothetical protein [Caldicellulosiruptor saccharolyticus]
MQNYIQKYILKLTVEKNTSSIGFSIPSSPKKQIKSKLQGYTKQKLWQARKHILFACESSNSPLWNELASANKSW